MKHSGKKYRYQPKTAGDILHRLPLHRSMGESQAALVKITPAWRAWISQATEQGRISVECASTTRLLAWKTTSNSEQAEHGQLTIACSNPANATLIKQQQQSILEHLNTDTNPSKQGVPNIKSHQAASSLQVSKLVIRLEMQIQALPLTPTPQAKTARQIDPDNAVAIEGSLRACQNQTNNEKLANSLKNLASTISSMLRES